MENNSWVSFKQHMLYLLKQTTSIKSCWPGLCSITPLGDSHDVILLLHITQVFPLLKPEVWLTPCTTERPHIGIHMKRCLWRNINLHGDKLQTKSTTLKIRAMLCWFYLNPIIYWTVIENKRLGFGGAAGLRQHCDSIENRSKSWLSNLPTITHF